MTSAQRQLNSELNLSRASDDLMKEQIVHFEPGKAGENQIWDFSKIRMINDAYIVHYFTRNDWEIVGAENGKLSFLKVKGGLLLLCGYETPSRLVKYQFHNTDCRLGDPERISQYGEKQSESNTVVG